MSQQTHEIMSKIDDIKDKISNQDYIDLSNLLKKKSENDCHEQLYRVKYFSQRMKLVVEEHPDTNSPLNDIICKHKTVICKFDENESENSIKELVKSMNDPNRRSIYGNFRENLDDGITRLHLDRVDDTHFADITGLINAGDDYDMDEITCRVKFKENIIYSIEKVDEEWDWVVV